MDMLLRPRTLTSPVRLLAVALALVAGLALTVLAASPASAHVVLQGAEPPVDSSVPTAPAQVMVLMSGEVSEAGSTLTVTGPDGQPADAGDGGLDLNSLNRDTLTVTLLPSLPNGLYTVNYSAAPADGHEPAVGSYTFTVGSADAATTPVLAGATPAGTPAATPIATPGVSTDGVASTPVAIAANDVSTVSEGGLTRNHFLLIFAAAAILFGGLVLAMRFANRPERL